MTRKEGWLKGGLLSIYSFFDRMKHMALSMGIVGLPNVGKSTLFQTFTKKQVDRSNYPFCTISPTAGVAGVPDERLDKLAFLTNSKKKI